MVNFKNSTKGMFTGNKKSRSRSNSDAPAKKSSKKKDENVNDSDKVNSNQNDLDTAEVVSQISQTLANKLNCIVCSKPVDVGSIECDI